jgi:hypothetical protein
MTHIWQKRASVQNRPDAFPSTQIPVLGAGGINND